MITCYLIRLIRLISWLTCVQRVSQCVKRYLINVRFPSKFLKMKSWLFQQRSHSKNQVFLSFLIKGLFCDISVSLFHVSKVKFTFLRMFLSLLKVALITQYYHQSLLQEKVRHERGFFVRYLAFQQGWVKKSVYWW